METRTDEELVAEFRASLAARRHDCYGVEIRRGPHDMDAYRYDWDCGVWRQTSIMRPSAGNGFYMLTA